jgi:hypothetical protein
MKRIALFLITVAALSSCGGNEAVCKECEQEKKDTVAVVEEPTLEQALADDKVEKGMTKDQAENHVKIVKKYGEQWDFCKCVVANDSINDAFEKNLTPKQEDALMKRWDYVDSKCKEMTTLPSTTPEEREAHERKVKKCLKENGLSM